MLIKQEDYLVFTPFNILRTKNLVFLKNPLLNEHKLTKHLAKRTH